MDQIKSNKGKIAISAFYIILGCSLLVITIFLSYRGITSAIDTVFKESSLILMQSVESDADGFSEFFGLYKNTAVPLTNHRYLQDYLRTGEDYSSYINDMLANVKRIGNLDAAYILDENGVCLFSTDDSLISKDYSFRPYFLEAIEGNDSVYLAEGVTTYKTGVYFSTPIYVEEEIRAVGVIKIGVENINNLLNEVKHFDSSIYGLSTETGVLLATSTNEVLSISDLGQKAIAEIELSRQLPIEGVRSLELEYQYVDENGIEFYLDRDGENYVVAKSPIEDLGVTLTEIIPYDAAFKNTESISAAIRYIIYAVSIGVVSIVIIFLLLLIEERSNRKRVEKMTEKLHKFKLAFENASDHMVITDPDGIAIHANKKATDITGYANEEIIGRKVGTKDNWGGLMDAEVYEELWDTVKNKKRPYQGFLRNKRKNGTIYEVEVKISPVLSKAGEVQYFVGIERDVTKEKKLERAKSEFVSLASHQLRTPLTAIRWILEILNGDEMGKLNKKQRELLGQAAQSNERMVSLINDLLNISRIESGRLAVEPEPIDIISLCKDIVKEIKPVYLKKRQNFSFKYEKDIPIINLDKKLIWEAVLNLLSNAIKYTEEKGKITLDVRIKKDKLLISVIDTGFGIPDEDKSKLFEKFYRSEKAIATETEGTGLGLFMVKAVIEASAGNVWFESEEGKGSTFTISLPLTGSMKVKGEKALSEGI